MQKVQWIKFLLRLFDILMNIHYDNLVTSVVSIFFL